MVNTWISLFSQYFRKFLQGTHFSKLGFLQKYVQKMLSEVCNCYLISYSTNRLEVYQTYFFPRFESTDFLLIAFFRFGFLLFFGFGFSFFCPELSLFLSAASQRQNLNFTSAQVSWIQSHKLTTVGIHQNGYPKTSFSNFLKYGENKESRSFTLDNTSVLKVTFTILECLIKILQLITWLKF